MVIVGDIIRHSSRLGDDECHFQSPCHRVCAKPADSDISSIAASEGVVSGTAYEDIGEDSLSVHSALSLPMTFSIPAPAV